jgi:hypothetical protein
LFASQLAATRKDIGHAFGSLPLPGAHLVRMHLMPRRDLLDRPVTRQRF